MRRTVNANSSGLRVTPRCLLVQNPPTSTMAAFTPPCKPKPPIQFSSHPTTMHILNQHTSYTPPGTAVWCASGAEHGVRSGGVEASGPSERRISWQEEVNGKEDIDESEEAKKTWQTVPRSSTPSYFHPYRKPKHPTKTSGHPTMTFCQGPLYILPVVQLRILRVLCEFGTGH